VVARAIWSFVLLLDGTRAGWTLDASLFDVAYLDARRVRPALLEMQR